MRPLRTVSIGRPKKRLYFSHFVTGCFHVQNCVAVRANRNEVLLWIYFVRSILLGYCLNVVDVNKVLRYIAVDSREVNSNYSPRTW